ncbi:MAG: methionyl-tRNA formyltransferase [Alphaproteobacteria bacterium]
MDPRLRIAFMGTPDFAVPTLAMLCDSGHDVVAVYSQPPRPAGRGQALRPSPVHLFADRHRIPVHTPVSLKGAVEQQTFAALGLDLAVVVAYGLILPPAILAAPRLGCVNVHASLLPRWRGAAPIQRAILAGDAETGVTLMQMDAGLDTGPMLARGAIPIGPQATAASLHDAVAVLGADCLRALLPALAAGRAVAEPQPADGVTYAAKLSRDEGAIDWRRPAAELDRMVRALNPWPGTRFRLGDEEVKLVAARPADGAGAPGTIVAAPLVVACGSGALSLDRLQRPGRAPVDGAAFANGTRLQVGDRLPCPASS